MTPQMLEKTKKKSSKTASPPEEFLTTQELMKLLKIRHKQTIYKLIAEGMPVIIAGQRNYRFIRSEVISFLKDESQTRLKKGSGQPDGD